MSNRTALHQPASSAFAGRAYVQTIGDDIDDIVRMVDAVESLWGTIRECISIVSKGDPEGGSFGPVGGFDWAVNELSIATRRAAEKAEKAEVGQP